MAVYLSAEARAQIGAAQAQLNRHALSLANDRCVCCDVTGPCEQRRAALRLLGRYGLLPARRPGATRPDRVGRGSDGFGWLRPASHGVT